VCIEVPNDLDAIAKAEVSRPDLIILDLCMPEMNGFEAATILHKTMPQVPLFMVTSHHSRDVESQAASVGIRAVFSKQTDINALVAQATEVLRPSRTGLIFRRDCPDPRLNRTCFHRSIFSAWKVTVIWCGKIRRKDSILPGYVLRF
jgi:CheY-like chemotaxis protein